MLDILVQSRRDGAAEKRFFKCSPERLHDTPRILITDKLRSDGVAKRELLPEVEHRESRYLSTERRTRIGRLDAESDICSRFKSARQAQRFLSAHAFISGHFCPRRHLMTAGRDRVVRAKVHGRVYRGIRPAPAPRLAALQTRVDGQSSQVSSAS